jgi:co-chaperonin GroES (HSP10)
VLIQPDKVSRETAGGIVMIDDIADRHDAAAITGVVIECGDEAFKWNADRTRPFGGRKPEPGSRIIFERYAGKTVTGKDGETYRIIEDKSVGGIEE